jgi:hypothetical protein
MEWNEMEWKRMERKGKDCNEIQNLKNYSLKKFIRINFQ